MSSGFPMPIEPAAGLTDPAQKFPKILFQVQVPLNGAELWTLCTCDTPEAAAEVVRCLLKVPSAGPQRVNVEKIYA